MSATTDTGRAVAWDLHAGTPMIAEFATAAEGLACEMAMLHHMADIADGAEADPTRSSAAPVGLIWRALEPGLVLPARLARAPGFETAAAASARRGWPVNLRATGGGLTPQGPGVMNLALCFAQPKGAARNIARSYDALCDPLRAALGDLGLDSHTGAVNGSFCDGDYNLAIAGRKIVGTAQRWRRQAVLCHALVLVDLGLGPAVAAIQAMGDDLGQDLAYRRAAHTTLRQETGGAAGVDALVSALWAQLRARGIAPWPAQ